MNFLWHCHKYKFNLIISDVQWVELFIYLGSPPHMHKFPWHNFVGAPPGLSPAHDECDWYKDTNQSIFFQCSFASWKDFAVFFFSKFCTCVLVYLCFVFFSCSALSSQGHCIWVFCLSFIPIHLTKTIEYWENSTHYSLVRCLLTLYCTLKNVVFKQKFFL